MYTFKDKELTEEQIAKFAEEKGVDVATFLANNPEIKGKKQPTTQEDAEIVDVTGASQKDTELLSEDGSLESKDNKYITPLTGEEKISLQNNQFAKQMAKENNFTKERLIELEKAAKDPYGILKDIKSIDEEIELIAGKDMKVDPLDSPKRIKQYNELALKRNSKLEEARDKISNRGTFSSIYQAFKQGDSNLGEMLLSVPSFFYEVGALFSDPINRALGLPETDLKKFEESIGTRPLLDELIAEQENLSKQREIYKDIKNIKGDAYGNLSKGNFKDGFYLLGESLAESAPVSISLMMGGAAGLSRTALTLGGGVPLAAGELRTQQEEYPDQSREETLLKSSLIGMSEGFFEGILGAGALGGVYKNIIKKQGLEQGKKTFKDGLVTMYQAALEKYGIPVALAGNGFEEAATQATQNIVNGKPISEGVANAFTIGLGSGGVYGAPVNIAKGVEYGQETLQKVNVNKLIKKTEYTSISEAFNPEIKTEETQIKLSQNPNSIKVLDQQLKNQVSKGEKTQEEADAVALNFRQTQGTVNSIKPLRLSESDQAITVELLKEKKQLTEEIKQVGEPSLTIEQSNRIKEINNDLKSIGSKAVTQEVEKVKKAAESIKDLDVQEFASTEETEAFLNEQGQDPKASGQQGFIIQNPKTGKQTIVINREIANKEIAVAAPSHEFLHALLFQTVKDSPETQLALGNSLKEYINKIDVAKVKDSNFAKRLEQYKSEPEAVQAEEVLTLFSDAIRTEDIKFNETIFTKIGDVIRKALQALGVKVKFNNGKDVYNFIKDYNKSLESTGLTKAQIKAAEGITGKLVADKVKTDEQTIKESRSTVLEAINELVPTDVKTKEEFQSPRVFNLVFNSLINEGGAINNYIRSRTTSKQEAEKAIESVQDRLLNFDPAAVRKEGKTVGAEAFGEFIFANTNFGKLDAKKELFKESEKAKQETALDAPEVTTQVADEVSIDEDKVKSTTSKLRRVLGIKQDDAIYDLAKKVSEDILTGELPGKKVKTAINREARKSELRKAVSDLMGTEKAIDEQFLNKNILGILKALPASDLVKLEREAKVKVLAEQGPRLSVKEAREAVNKGLLPKDTNLQSGPKLSTKLSTTLEQAKEFFTQKRKQGLVNVITEMLVKDAAPEVTKGKMEPAKRAKVLSEIDREPTLKFSQSLKDKPDLLKYFNEELKGLSPGQIVQEMEFLENRAEILGMEQDEAFEQMFTNDNSYKKLRKTLKLKDGGKRNISSKENSKQLKKTHSLFIKGMIPKGKEFKDLPKQTQQFLLDTIGFGDTRITIGDVPLTYKAVTEGVKGYEGLLAKMYGKDILKGTGSDFNFIDVFAPRNWGEKGFRGKVQKIVESNKDNKLKARKEVEKLLTPKDGNVTKTIKANRDALTRAYDVLADIVIKNPSKETISAVADLLESQVNRATGVFKGLVPVTSFNMKPEKGNTKNENKMMHNEHLVELFNANKFFIESLSKFVEGKINESELLNMSRVNAASLEQAVISERMRVEKDASGAAVRDFLNPLTFLGKDAVNQVPIGVEPLAVSEQIAQDLEKKQKELVKKASDKKLNSVGVIVKQLLDNNRVYLYTKSKNSDKLSKLIKLSKSETNQEILNIMKSVDDASQKVELKFSKSLDLNKDFNDIIENKTGIASDKTYARVKAEVAGANKGKFNFFIPPSAEDFVGLLYATLGKGDIGTAQMAWYKAHLLNPFARAMENIANDRVSMMQDYRGLKKALKIVPKDLRKKLKDSNFTKEQAVRVAIWDTQGMSVPGLSQKDQKQLVEYVNANADLKAFADQLIAINKGDEYASPDDGWVAGTIDTDFIKSLNTTKRAKYLEVWQQNVDEIFSEANLNKLEAAYGKAYRVAMENILHRMKTGRNRSFGTDTVTGRFTDWLTNSVGAIMFFNTRSAVLQTISAVNFINFTDNNILKAGLAFANQKQYWSDFAKLFNSPFLLDRRSGIKINVNEADIADMAKGPGNSARNVLAGILRLGFLPTQIADSFAIASGGATFYRNRIKALKKEGLTDKEAEEIAFRDFREIAEESQQSSRPDKISQQQAGPLGRVILAFANTPAQYARLIKKAASDLKNGRGDAKTNISKIIYYGVAQNLLFSALQQAVFALSFGPEEEEEEKREEKYFNVANSMADSILRGIGVGGAIASVVKNTAIKLAKEAEKKSPKFQDVLVKEVTQISPPVSSKLSKLRSAGRSLSWNQEEMKTMGWSIDNPAYLASAQVISAITNVPLDRAVKKITNIKDASDESVEYYKRVALALGWSAWELGIKKDSKGKIKKVQPLTDMDKLYKLNKKEQIDSLLSLGLSKKQIKALKKEEDRVKAILDPKSVKEIKVSKRDSLFGLNKKEQVEALTKLGYSKKEIRALRLESDRVEAIINKQKQEN